MQRVSLLYEHSRRILAPNVYHLPYFPNLTRLCDADNRDEKGCDQTLRIQMEDHHEEGIFELK